MNQWYPQTGFAHVIGQVVEERFANEPTRHELNVMVAAKRQQERWIVGADHLVISFEANGIGEEIRLLDGISWKPVAAATMAFVLEAAWMT